MSTRASEQEKLLLVCPEESLGEDFLGELRHPKGWRV